VVAFGLAEGQTPANSLAMVVVAVVAAIVLVALLLGWWIKFLVFRPLAGRTSMATQGLTAPIAVSATGGLARTVGGERAYERTSRLQPAPVDPTHPLTAAVDLVWNDDEGITGVRLLPGVTEAVMGTA
jgi:branched-subunit amino acid ABC-type transport system permease component